MFCGRLDGVVCGRRCALLGNGMDFASRASSCVGIGGKFLHACGRPSIARLDSTARTGSLLGGVFQRQFYRCYDRTSAGCVVGIALSLATQFCHHWRFGLCALGRVALVLPYSRASPLVVVRRTDGYFARPRVKRGYSGKRLSLSSVVAACCPQFLFHAFPNGPLYVLFPFFGSPPIFKTLTVSLLQGSA